jgi:hypothetical protein
VPLASDPRRLYRLAGQPHEFGFGAFYRPFCGLIREIFGRKRVAAVEEPGVQALLIFGEFLVGQYGALILIRCKLLAWSAPHVDGFGPNASPANPCTASPGLP